MSLLNTELQVFLFLTFASYILGDHEVVFVKWSNIENFASFIFLNTLNHFVVTH